MGCIYSTNNGDDEQAVTTKKKLIRKIRNNAIEDKINVIERQENQKVKYLILGTGESGKSTIFKQMRILHGSPMTDDELRMWGVVIRSNVLTVVKQLCNLIRMLEVEDEFFNDDAQPEYYGGNSRKETRSPFKVLILHFAVYNANPLHFEVYDTQAPEPGGGAIVELLSNDWVGHCQAAGLGPNRDAKVMLELANPIKALWQSKIMKFVWQKRSLVNIVDSHKAFLDDIDRIVSPTFKPTLQDVLLARKRTTNVTVQRYRIGPTDYELYDVGGQRQERRKWFQCFDRVDGVIFVGALSEYDQHLSESKKQNRLVETLELFRSVCMNRAFINTPVILFLNKIDILAEKIQYSDIAAQKPFTDYKGPKNNFSYAVQYFIEKFKECLVEGEYNTNFIQPCTATDTDNIRFVMDATRSIITAENLRYAGLL